MPMPRSRTWHYMRPNHVTRTPSNLLFVDTETTPIPDNTYPGLHRHELKLWAAEGLRLEQGKATRRVIETGCTALEFWALVHSRLDPKRPLWLWAHSLSFDMLALSMAEYLDAGRLSLALYDTLPDLEGNPRQVETWRGLVVLDDPPSIIELKDKLTGAKCLMLDTMNWFRMPLEDLGHAIDYPKWPMPSQHDDTETWQQYCLNDVAIIRKAVLSLIETIKEYDLGNMRYTAPSQGLQAYRHRFMDHKILVHCNEDALAMERQAYFGGTCMARRVGIVDGQIYVLDVQSFYPWLMSCHALPYHFDGFAACADMLDVVDIMREQYIIAYGLLESPTGLFPYRLMNQPVMATGKAMVCLHWPELMGLIQTGAYFEPHKVAVYRADILFQRFAREMWTMRRTAELCGKQAHAQMLKLIANGLHGKLGQRQIDWIDRPDLQNDKRWASWKHYDYRLKHLTEFRCINGTVQSKRKPGEHWARPWVFPNEEDEPGNAINDESYNSCPSIAGAITAWGRTVIAEIMAIAGHAHTFYIDTDCVHVDQTGYEALLAAGRIVENALGQLSVKQVASQAEYIGPKAYRLDDQWTVAGLKRNATQIADKHWTQTNFSGWSVLLYEGINGGLIETTQDFPLTEGAVRGSVDSNGWVTPIRLGGKHGE